MYKVFLSFNPDELEELASAARDRLELLEDLKATDRTRWGTRPEDVRDAIVAECAGSDLYVGVFGKSYGQASVEGEMSPEHWAYQTARSQGIPCLIYLMETPETECDDRMRELRGLLRSRHQVTSFRHKSDFLLALLTGLYNLDRARPRGRPAGLHSSPEPEGAVSPEEPLPEPLKWYRDWMNSLLRMAGRRVFLRRLVQWGGPVVLVIVGLFYFHLLPKALEEKATGARDSAFIWAGMEPRHCREPGSDAFTAEGDRPIKWAAPPEWRLTGYPDGAPHNRMLVAGDAIGFFKTPSQFESYYDYAVQFTVKITCPRGGISWILRYDPGSRQYYRFDFEFPVRETEGNRTVVTPGKLTGGRYRDQHKEDKLLINQNDTTTYAPFHQDSILSVRIRVAGNHFDHILNYVDSLNEVHEDFNDTHDRVAKLEDSSRTLKWGSPGFAAFPKCPAMLVVFFNLTPLPLRDTAEPSQRKSDPAAAKEEK